MPRLYPVLSIVGFLILWAAGSALINDPLFPGPHEVILKMYSEAQSGELFKHLLIINVSLF